MHNGQLANPNKFKSLTDISKAAYLFMDQYERPGVLRWKERNTWAYKAYKHYTGKDYIDVTSTLYPGPDQAISAYKAGANPITEMLPEDPQKFIRPNRIAGVSKVSALGFADGGFTGPITTPIGYKKPGVPYSRSGRPIGNPFGQYWGELSRFIGPRRPGMDIWGGTEIPGLKFTGNIPQMSDYWHQIQEQPRKPFNGPGMGIDKDPMQYVGSGASMGGIGNGAYGLGPLMFHKGGAVGHTHSGGMPSFNPFGMGMEWLGKTLKSGISSVSKFALGFDPMKPLNKQSGLEKLAMATMLIPGGSATAGASLSALKPFSKFFKDFEIAFTPGTVPDL